jgi:hypothetical protein
MLAVVLVLIGCGMLAAAGPAAAGGPTSVLIVEPESGRTAAAYYDDPAYAALDALVSGEPSGPVQAADGSFGSRGTGRMITVTWLVHDVWVWRVNRVFPDAPGGPWVLTLVAADPGTLPESGTWSRPDDPKKVVDVLELALGSPVAVPRSDQVGVSTTVTRTVEHTVTAPASSSSTALAAPAGGSGSSPTGSSPSGWSTIVVAGVAAIGLAMLLLGRLVIAARRRRPGPAVAGPSPTRG